MAKWLVVLPLLLIVCLPATEALKFRIQLPRLGRQCYYQDVLQNTLLVISVWTGEGAQIELRVNHGDTIIFQERSQPLMKTAFTTTDSGDHVVCVANFGPSHSTVTLQIDEGSAAKDYTQIARKEHLDPFILSLRKVEDMLREYHKNLLHLRSREIRMRHANDRISSRLVMFCFLTMSVMFAATVAQILYFRSFLRSKKII